MASERYDVAVIGAGIVGVSTALHLLMRGLKVVMIDRRAPGEETSYGNAGLIETVRVLPYDFPSPNQIMKIALGRDISARMRYADLPSVMPWVAAFYMQSRPERWRENGRLTRPLVADALEEHKTLMRGADAERYLSAAGYAFLYRTEACFSAAKINRAVAHETGIPFDVMDAPEFAAIEPHVKSIFHKAVVWKTARRLTNPGAVVKAYAERFSREGGAYIRALATGLESDANGWRIETQGGAIDAKQIVACTGPWGNDLLKPLGYHFPFGFKRGYHKHFKAAAEVSLAHAVLDADIGYFIVPMEQGYRLTTGAEFARRDAPPNPVQLERALPYARQVFPLGEPIEKDAWMGSRPCFPDSLPVIGPATRHPGLWLNIGHGHLGLTMGPASGRLITEMMVGEKTFCDPAPYHAGRFG